MHKQIHVTLMTISQSIFRSTSLPESPSKAQRVQLYAVPCWHYPRYFAFLFSLQHGSCCNPLLQLRSEKAVGSDTTAASGGRKLRGRRVGLSTTETPQLWGNPMCFVQGCSQKAEVH